jgi:hypothetical protein
MVIKMMCDGVELFEDSIVTAIITIVIFELAIARFKVITTIKFRLIRYSIYCFG